MLSKDKEVVIEIENSEGGTLMAFIIRFEQESNEFEIVKTSNCNIADVDGDYIFDSDNELIRIQAEEDY